MIPLSDIVALSAFLFCTGIWGVLTRRNVIGVLMSLELILNAANINLVAFNKYLGAPDGLGQVFTLFVIAIAAAGSVVGLALVIALCRSGKSVYMDEINLMKW
jgi:NADH:ubiquinone oxidoreductase subunit K